ncbi:MULTISPECIES: MFS transporter [unclassified Agarivorans]|uniref:MFS transporter n=2 Tax=unclassified Agarivorans TaxID=2636026 RepID=UPI003D7F10E5
MLHSNSLNSHASGLLSPLAGLGLFAIATGYLMSLLPLALSYFELDKSLSPWLASAFYSGLLLGALKIQVVINTLGHRRALILFFSGILVTVLLMPLLSYSSVWLILRGIAGAATAGVFVVIESWLLLVDDDKQRAKRLGLYMVTLYAGNAFGQLLIEHLGSQGHLPFVCIISLLSLAILAPILSRSTTPQVTRHQSLSLKAIGQLSTPAVIGCLVSGLILGPIYGLMPGFLNDNDLWQNQLGQLMATLILGGMLIQPLASYLSARFSKTLLQALFCLMGFAAAIAITLANSLLSLGLSLFALGAAAFSLYPVAICQASLQAKAEHIVAITELMLLSYSIGSIIGPLIAGLGETTITRLPLYLAATFASTCIYMLIVAAKNTAIARAI